MDFSGFDQVVFALLLVIFLLFSSWILYLFVSIFSKDCTYEERAENSFLLFLAVAPSYFLGLGDVFALFSVVALLLFWFFYRRYRYALLLCC